MLDRLRSLFRPSVQGRIPSEPVMYRFQANEDFWSPEFKSQYLKGLQYSVREGNMKLHSAVRDWTAEGKVKVL